MIYFICEELDPVSEGMEIKMLGHILFLTHIMYKIVFSLLFHLLYITYLSQKFS